MSGISQPKYPPPVPNPQGFFKLEVKESVQFMRTGLGIIKKPKFQKALFIDAFQAHEQCGSVELFGHRSGARAQEPAASQLPETLYRGKLDLRALVHSLKLNLLLLFIRLGHSYTRGCRTFYPAPSLSSIDQPAAICGHDPSLSLGRLTLNRAVHDLDAGRLGVAKMPEDQPRRVDGNSPETEIHVDTTDLAKDRQRRQPVGQGLPGRLGAAQKGGVSDDFGLVPAQVVDEEIS